MTNRSLGNVVWSGLIDLLVNRFYGSSDDSYGIYAYKYTLEFEMSCLYTDGLEVESRTVFCLGRFRNVPHSKLRSDNVKCKILDN